MSGLPVIRPQSRIGPWQISGKYNSARSAALMGILFVPRGGAGRTPIPADQTSAVRLAFPKFGLLDYRGWPRRRLHSPRAERMKVKPPSPPSAQSVQTKKKPPGDLAISP